MYSGNVSDYPISAPPLPHILNQLQFWEGLIHKIVFNLIKSTYIQHIINIHIFN